MVDPGKPKQSFSEVMRSYAVVPHKETSSEELLLLIVEIALQLLFSWTISYHLCVALQLAAQWIALPFVLIFAGLVTHSMSRWKHAAQGKHEARWFVAATLLLGVGLGIFALIVSRPDADDVQYFHRALVQLQYLDQPVVLTDTIHNVPNLPLSSVITVTSYELLVAMAANAFGIDPLFAYHNLAPFVASILLMAVYFLVYRQFGLEPKLALTATLLVCVFLLIDGNLHRSFGNVTIARLWQGKAIMWSLLIPLSLLTSYRYLENPGPSRFFMALMTAVAALGLSSSGLFLIPAMTFSVSLAFLLNHGPTRTNLKNAVLVNLTSVYSTCILMAMFFGWLPTYPPSELFDSWPSTWTGLMGFVVDSGATLVRNLVLLLAVPAVLLSKPYHRFFVILTVVLMFLFTNPVMGPLFVKLLQPGAYWRIAYLFPLPLCAGLLVCAFAKPPLKDRLTWLPAGMALLALASIIFSYKHSIVTPINASSVYLKHPMSYRFKPAEYEFSSSIADQLDGRNLLAPERIVHVLPLLNPTIRVETARKKQTQFNFATAGMAKEGLRRVNAQVLVTSCQQANASIEAFIQSIEEGVDAVVLGNKCSLTGMRWMIELLKSLDDEWNIAEENHGYTLLLHR